MKKNILLSILLITVLLSACNAGTTRVTDKETEMERRTVSGKSRNDTAVNEISPTRMEGEDVTENDPVEANTSHQEGDIFFDIKDFIHISEDELFEIIGPPLFSGRIDYSDGNITMYTYTYIADDLSMDVKIIEGVGVSSITIRASGDDPFRYSDNEDQILTTFGLDATGSKKEYSSGNYILKYTDLSDDVLAFEILDVNENAKTYKGIQAYFHEFFVR